MKIFVCYAYDPFTTGGYFEKAFREEHDVYYIGPPSAARSGYLPNEDLANLIEQGCMPKPDLVFFIDSPGRFFPRGLEKIQSPTACYLIDVHQGLQEREIYALFFDYIFVAQKDYIEHFKRKEHPNVFWLPLACDPEIHGKRDMPKYFDIGFVGSPNFSLRRQRLLDLLARNFKMNDYQRFYPKEEISNIYSKSKIVFNCSVNGDLNMRVFESLASGSMLITDRIDNGLYDLFKDGVHLVSYQDEGSLLKKIEYYLKHDEEREAIATSGMQLALSAHTYKHRVQTILETIFSMHEKRLTSKVRSKKSGEIHTAYAKVYSMLRLVDPVFDEFSLALHEKAGRFSTGLLLIKATLRRLNALFKLTVFFRRLVKTFMKGNY